VFASYGHDHYYLPRGVSDPETEVLSFPRTLAPMLASSGSLPKADDEFAYEFKWDGIRAIVFLENGRVRIQSRTLRDMTLEYPELEQLGYATRQSRLVLDGELICIGADGRPCFERIQSRIGRGKPLAIAFRQKAAPATLMVFDLLFQDGTDLRPASYSERRKRLDDLGLSGSCFQTPQAYVGGGAAVLQTARDHQLEGVICKRLGSRYRCGKRTDEWLKVKNRQTATFTIGGWVHDRDGRMEALLVGTPKWDGSLEFVSRVELGRFGQIMPLLESLRRKESPFGFDLETRRARYVRPVLKAEFAFLYRTRSGWLREGCFKRLLAPA